METWEEFVALRQAEEWAEEYFIEHFGSTKLDRSLNVEELLEMMAAFARDKLGMEVTAGAKERARDFFEKNRKGET